MWRKDLADEIIAQEFSSPDLELAWLDEDESEPKALEAMLEGRVKLGAVTLNEMRDALAPGMLPLGCFYFRYSHTCRSYVGLSANKSTIGFCIQPWSYAFFPQFYLRPAV